MGAHQSSNVAGDHVVASDLVVTVSARYRPAERPALGIAGLLLRQKAGDVVDIDLQRAAQPYTARHST